MEYKVTNPDGARIYNEFKGGVLKDRVGKIPYGEQVPLIQNLGKALFVEYWVGKYVLADDMALVEDTPPDVDVTPPDEFMARWKNASGEVVVTREYKRV